MANQVKFSENLDFLLSPVPKHLKTGKINSLCQRKITWMTELLCVENLGLKFTKNGNFSFRNSIDVIYFAKAKLAPFVKHFLFLPFLRVQSSDR